MLLLFGKEFFMKGWLQEYFLPMWAKESVLRDNRELKRALRKLGQKNRELRAYIQGLETALRAFRQSRHIKEV